MTDAAAADDVDYADCNEISYYIKVSKSYVTKMSIYAFINSVLLMY